jgi:hypothetical protein
MIFLVFVYANCYSKQTESDYIKFIETFKKYDELLRSNNYYEVTIKSKFLLLNEFNIDSTESKLIFQQNNKDKVVGYSYYFDYKNIIYYNHNDINYQFDKNNNNYFKKTKIKFLNDVGRLYTSDFTFFIPYNDDALHSSFKDSNYHHSKVEVDNDDFIQFYVQNTNITDDMLFSYRFVFDKTSKLLKNIDLINTMFGNTYIIKYEIVEFKISNKSDNDFLNIDSETSIIFLTALSSAFSLSSCCIMLTANRPPLNSIFAPLLSAKEVSFVTETVAVKVVA